MNAGLIETFKPDQQARLHGCGYLLYIRVSLPPHSVLFCFQTVYTYPLEVLRRRMQVHSMDSRQRAASLWTLAILAKTTAFRELFAGHIFESNPSCCQQFASSGHNTWQVEEAINTTVMISL